MESAESIQFAPEPGAEACSLEPVAGGSAGKRAASGRGRLSLASFFRLHEIAASSRRLSRAHWAGAAAFALALGLLSIHPHLALWPLALFVALCFTAPPFPRWSFFLPILSAGPPGSRGVTLTFDDGPDPVSTLPLLDLLSRHGVKAAFFVVGECADAHPELIREILARGHEIGNHSHTHDLFLMLRESPQLEREVVRCQEILQGQGVHSKVFRPPLGITNPRLHGVLERLGMSCVCFAFRPADFGNRRVAGLAGKVLTRVKPGEVVLLHDCEPRGGLAAWLREVEEIIRGVRKKGLELVSLSTLLGWPVMQVEEERRISA